MQGGRRVTGHWEKVRAGQAGRRIVEEAREMRARAIVMPLPGARRRRSLFGKTLETVLAERPCRVIIESAPDERAAAEPPREPRRPRTNGAWTLRHRSGSRHADAAPATARHPRRCRGDDRARRRAHRAHARSRAAAAALGVILGVLFVAVGAGRLCAGAVRMPDRSGSRARGRTHRGRSGARSARRALFASSTRRRPRALLRARRRRRPRPRLHAARVPRSRGVFFVARRR